MAHESRKLKEKEGIQGNVIRMRNSKTRKEKETVEFEKSVSEL